MTRLLSGVTVKAIADLGHNGVKFDEDVLPALAAVGLDVVRCQASYRATETMESLFVPGPRDHIMASLSALDLGDPDMVDRVLRFTARIAQVYAAGATADHAKVVRLRNALADDGYNLDMSGGSMAGFSINKREIARMMRDMQREFDKHPIQVPVKADTTGSHVSSTTIYNGPVIHGNAAGAQLAWGNQTVNQIQQARPEQIAPGFEAIAQAVVKTLEGLPPVGLTEDDKQDAEAAANEVLTEVTQPEPDRGKLRRALAA